MNRHDTDKDNDYSDLHRHINLFFGETFPALIREADSRFQHPLRNWLRETYKELLRLRKEKKDTYERSVEILHSNLPGLRRAISEMESKPMADEIRNMLISELDELPGSIEQNQSEERFNAAEGDSPYIILRKLVKRTARKFSGEKKYQTQVIPVRDIIAQELLEDMGWLQIWISESYLDQSEILELFLEKPEENQEGEGASDQDPDSDNGSEKGDEHHSNGEEEESGEAVKESKKSKKQSGEAPEANSFRIEVIDEFEQHLEQVIKRIESTEILQNENLDEYLEMIRNRVIRRCERAGTVEERKTIRPFKKNDALDEPVPGKIKEQESAWLTCLKSIRNDLQIQNEIADYGIEAVDARKNMLSELHNFFRDFGYLPIEQTISASREMSEQLKKTGKSSLTAKLTDDLRDKLKSDIQDEALSKMNDEEAMKKFVTSIQEELSDLQLEQSGFTETIRLAEKRELSLPAPKIRFDELNWRSLASRHIQEKALREMNPEKADLIGFMKQISEKMTENLQIVDVNLAAAYESKDHEAEERPLDIALGGIERAISQFEELIRQIRDKQNGYEKLIRERLDKTLHDLADTMLSREYDAFEIQDKALQVKETALKWTDKLEIIAGDALEKSRVLWRFLMQKLKKGRAVAGRFLGFTKEEGISSKEKRSLSEYLTKSDQNLELPFIYRRLFEPGFEIDSRFNITPDGFYTTMEGAYASWKEGLETNVLILGERGSGKTNAVRFSEEKLFEKEDVVHVVFDRTFCDEKTLVSYFSEALGYSGLETVEDLIEKIGNRRKRIVIAVENLQNTYIRNMHGFSAIEAFWVLISSTKKNIFWMVTISRYTWKFFEKMSSADQYFSHIDEIDTLTAEQVRKAVMVRHKSTGFQLLFEPAQSVKNSRAYKKLINSSGNDQEYLADYYFEKLANIAEGNMSVATIFWMQSIKEFDDKRMVIAPIEVADVDRLEVPSRNVLFTLAAFALHDTLNEEQLAMALHEDLNDSRLMIARLRSKGILQATDHGYRMNQLVYRQIIRMLKRRNILH
ncbi:hypothetical protein [Rhodohalobacter mucosus]|uniref:AAA domain-containing protein n=1 Tax=Rhodohalobacter mucosus TaxID=2079485 RepID=A0A316TTV5_9BACT|nr:hypothetical protein [Rhodohalobacter mucosus]PWN06425.1 hypothetical protein DDZ15_07820 [Rhodohalobacter mucosus]